MISQRIEKGFTTMELMVVIFTIAIIVSIAVPNFQMVFSKNRLASATNDVYEAVNYGRNLAITQKRSIIVCLRAASDDSENNPQCVSNSTDNQQHNGLIVASIKPTSIPNQIALNTVYRVFPAYKNIYIKVTLASNAAGNALVIGSGGRTILSSENSADYILATKQEDLCEPSSTCKTSKQVTVSPLSFPKIKI